MNATFVMGLGAQVAWLALKLVGPVLIAGLVVGVVIGILQAATQIQEQTLAFVPKLAVMILVLLALGPWMITILTDFAAHILGHLNAFIQ